jgi:hypothetical protein
VMARPNTQPILSAGPSSVFTTLACLHVLKSGQERQEKMPSSALIS